VKSTKLKLMSACVGAAAVVGMGVLTVAFSESSSAEPEPVPPGPVVTSEVSTGQTSTETTPPETPTTTIAEPSITGTAPLPSELEGVPG
jgi:hypothetical protein